MPEEYADFDVYTRKVWEPRLDKALSKEDCRMIAENMSGFLRVLQEWHAREEMPHE